MRLSSTARFNLFIFLVLMLLTAYAGCGGRDLAGDAKELMLQIFGPKTPRVKYRKQAINEAYHPEEVVARWEAAFRRAKATPLRVVLPHREVIVLDTTLSHSAQAVRLTLPPGRELTIRALSEAPQIFGELYRLKNGEATRRPIDYFTDDTREITLTGYDARPLELVFITQGTVLHPTHLEWQFTTRPLYDFPVAGKDDKAIQSFWGAPRDGGRRKHEGNDIFADKGTELLAVTAGTVTKVSNGGLGGKTVWLRDEATGLRFYYAHLDEQWVGKGQWVGRGQAVGTVGNTGNARTTPPHLHFGIYDGKAIDPFPFLKRTDKLPAASPLPYGKKAPRAVPLGGSHYLRLSPASNGAKIRQLRNGEAVMVLGVSGRFYRVVTALGEVGYANFE